MTILPIRPVPIELSSSVLGRRAILGATTILLMLTACSDKPATANNQTTPEPPAANVAAPADSGGVNPLGSQAVKDAIHRALRTGQTQRWSDAGLSGYAVPSPAADARGCRTIRYTIDQQPARSFPVITACDAG
jgi:hypothetical protein